MTQEDPGIDSPEDTPAPLASTRWAEEAEVDDDGLMPPFIPGSGGAGSVAPSPERETTGSPDESAGSIGAAGEAAAFDTPAEMFPFEPTRYEEAVPEPAGSDDFPLDAFDLSGGEAETPAAAAYDESATAAATTAGDADDVAERLEALARRLRDEGAGAAEAALASGDRLTALLAGVLAGYLAGRR